MLDRGVVAPEGSSSTSCCDDDVVDDKDKDDKDGCTPSIGRRFFSGAWTLLVEANDDDGTSCRSLRFLTGRGNPGDVADDVDGEDCVGAGADPDDDDDGETGAGEAAPEEVERVECAEMMTWMLSTELPLLLLLFPRLRSSSVWVGEMASLPTPLPVKVPPPPKCFTVEAAPGATGLTSAEDEDDACLMSRWFEECATG